MAFWNQDNFEGLLAAADAYAEKPGYEKFVEYCRLKEQGIKKQANAAIEAFVAELKSQTLERQRELADEFANLRYFNGQIHQLVPYHLHTFIFDTFNDWSANKDAPALVHRWLASLGAGADYYAKALKTNPTDQISLYELARYHLGIAEHITHHLSESKLLGTEDEIQQALETAEKLSARLDNQDAAEQFQRELSYYRVLLTSWQAFKKQTEIESFPDWCRSRGEDFNLPAIYYYQK